MGTGIGGGLVINGAPVHGLLHPEIGHVRVRRAPGDNFPGICSFHGDCVEGLTSGPALMARFGTAANKVAPNDPRWLPVARELAELTAMLLLTVSPRRSEEHTSELQSLMRISYAVFCLKKQN